jgi:hypothetical protein
MESNGQEYLIKMGSQKGELANKRRKRRRKNTEDEKWRRREEGGDNGQNAREWPRMAAKCKIKK